MLMVDSRAWQLGSVLRVLSVTRQVPCQMSSTHENEAKTATLRMIFRHYTELALVALLRASNAPKLWAVYICFHSIRLENRGEIDSAVPYSGDARGSVRC
jgi:hypothetical protein